MVKLHKNIIKKMVNPCCELVFRVPATVKHIGGVGVGL